MLGFPGQCSGDVGSIPGSERSPGGGHGSPLQYSCLESPMDREAWQATVYRVRKSWTWLKQLSTAQKWKGLENKYSGNLANERISWDWSKYKAFRSHWIMNTLKERMIAYLYWHVHHLKKVPSLKTCSMSIGCTCTWGTEFSKKKS